MKKQDLVSAIKAVDIDNSKLDSGPLALYISLDGRKTFVRMSKKGDTVYISRGKIFKRTTTARIDEIIK